MLIELEEAKKHLVIDPEFREDDEYIISLIDTSVVAVGTYIRRPLKEVKDEYGYLPSPLKSAVLLLVGNLYANREPVAFGTVEKIPFTFEYLTSLYQKQPPRP